MPKIVNPTLPPQTLSDLLTQWKTRPRSDGKKRADGEVATNGERTASDRLNYDRPWKDFALATTGSEDLRGVPVTSLALEEDRILDLMIQGATRRRGRPPSKHLDSSLRSWMRRVLTDMASELSHKSLRPLPGHKLWKPYRTTLPIFPTSNWPEGLNREFDTLQETYQDRFYAGPGRDQLRGHKVEPGTWISYRRAVNRVVEYVLTVEKLTEITLLDLVNYDRLNLVRAWYFKRKLRGGYQTFSMICMALAAITRYLEIVGRLHSGSDPFSQLPSAPWMRLFELAKETEAEGHRLGKIDRLPELPPLPPKEMEALAQKLWEGLPRRANGRPAPHQIHRRRQAAVFYGMAAGAPVRIKNWTQMRWGHNLYQDSNHHWWVYFRPEELKNGTRGRIPRKYLIKLPPSKGKWIERWREYLVGKIGPDFEAVCPYVFPGRRRTLSEEGKDVWKMTREDSFYRLIRDSCLEVRGHAYRPHAIRSDVTEYLLGKGDANMRSVLQAAMLLGDTEQTVLKIYNKPDVQAMLDEDYFADLSADD